MIEKQIALLPMIVINRFERSCGTFIGREGNTHCHQQHWVNLPDKKTTNKQILFYF